MPFRQLKAITQAFRDVFADSGFSMAGAVAYSFVLSLFPFCIFLGALAGYFGGETLAKQAVEQLFQMVPTPVAEAIAPEVKAVMGQSRFGLLTFGAFIALFFATSAIESLRAALNIAYRVKERRSYLWCLMQSSLFVVVSAIGMLALAWNAIACIVPLECAGHSRGRRLGEVRHVQGRRLADLSGRRLPHALRSHGAHERRILRRQVRRGELEPVL